MKEKCFDHRHPDAEIAHEVMHNFLNCFGSSNSKEFVVLMSRSHRTLQQNFTRLCVEWLKSLAELPDNWYDGRNEDSVRFAREIKEHLDNCILRFV